MNFDLWHEEDIARRDDLGAGRVLEAKRLIDRCNQARNDAIDSVEGTVLLRRGENPRTAIFDIIEDSEHNRVGLHAELAV